jgi:hypothetical protein
MKTWMLAALALQNPTAYETKAKYEGTLKAMEGVLDVSVGGINGNLKIVVRVADEKAKEAVTLFASKGLDGHGVHVLISAPTSGSSKVRSEEPKKATADKGKVPVKKEPISYPEERDTNIWKASALDCDILRTYLKLKPRPHQGGEARLDDCELMLRQILSAGGGHSYIYTKHRLTCPIRLGRVQQPAWADNFIGWLFQKGFGAAIRGCFLFPYELRASDKLWVRQVREDLMTRLHYIREGAEWVQTPGDRPGVGWTWTAPVTGGTPPEAVPTSGTKKEVKP